MKGNRFMKECLWKLNRKMLRTGFYLFLAFQRKLDYSWNRHSWIVLFI